MGSSSPWKLVNTIHHYEGKTVHWGPGVTYARQTGELARQAVRQASVCIIKPNAIIMLVGC